MKLSNPLRHPSEISEPEWEVLCRLADARLVIIPTGPGDGGPTDIAKMLGVSRATVYRHLAETAV